MDTTYEPDADEIDDVISVAEDSTRRVGPVQSNSREADYNLEVTNVIPLYTIEDDDDNLKVTNVIPLYIIEESDEETVICSEEEVVDDFNIEENENAIAAGIPNCATSVVETGLSPTQDNLSTHRLLKFESSIIGSASHKTIQSGTYVDNNTEDESATPSHASANPVDQSLSPVPCSQRKSESLREIEATSKQLQTNSTKNELENAKGQAKGQVKIKKH